MIRKLRKLEDLKEPILKVWERSDYTNNYLLSNMNILIQNGKLIQTFDSATNDMLLHSLKEYDNLDILMLINKSPFESIKFYEDQLKEKYSLVALKHESVDKDMFLKIMFQITYEKNNICSFRTFKESVSRRFEFYRNKSDEELIDLVVFVLIKRNSNIKQTSIIQENFSLYSPENKKEKWVLSTIFFNRNTMDLLKIQSLEYFFVHDIEEFKRRINIFRNFYFEHFDSNDQSQILLFSSIILNMIGHRKANDIDFMAHNISEEAKNRLLDFRERHLNHFRQPDNEDDNFIIENKNETIENNEKKNQFMDIFIKGTEHWPHYWPVWLEDWARKTGSKYFKEVLANGDFHCYFLGLKMVTLKMDIERRLARQRPRGHADIYSLKKRYNLQSIGIENFDIFVLGKKEGKFYQLKDITEEEYREHLANGAKLRDSVKEIYYEVDVDISKFLRTMKWCLETRYRIDKTIEEISKDLVLPKTTEKSERLKMQMRICKENEMDLTANYIMKMNNLRLEEEEKQKSKESKTSNESKESSDSNVPKLSEPVRIKSKSTSKRTNEVQSENKNNIQDSIVIREQQTTQELNDNIVSINSNNDNILNSVHSDTEIKKKRVLKKKSV